MPICYNSFLHITYSPSKVYVYVYVNQSSVWRLRKQELRFLGLVNVNPSSFSQEPKPKHNINNH